MRSRTAFSLALVLGLAPAPACPASAAEPGWVPLGPAAGQDVRSLAVRPGSPPYVLAGGASGVFRTADGSRWDLVNGDGLPLGETGRLYAAPVPGSPIYLVVDRIGFKTTGDAVFRSEDAGESWTRIKDYGGALAVAPSEPATLYLANPGGSDSIRFGIETSRDGGDTWTPAAPLPRILDGAFVVVAGVAVGPADPDTVFLLLDAIPDRGAPNNIFLVRSDDGGASWTVIPGPATGYQGATDLILDPHDPATLYLVLTTGVYRSTDGGATWALRNDGLPSYVFGPGRQTVVPVRALTIDPAAPATLYATVSADPRNGVVSGVFRSDDAGATWARAAQGLAPALSIGDVLVVGPGSASVYAGTSRGVFRSQDRGAHWSPTPGGLPTPVSAVAVDPLMPHTLFVGTGDQRLFASDDGGQAWRRSDAGLPLPLSDSFALPIDAFEIAPSAPAILFISTGSSFFNERSLEFARSTDGGATWEAAASPGGLEVPSPGLFRELLIDPRDPNRVLAGMTSRGVFLSSDLGAHWDLLLDGDLSRLVRAPSNPDVLYSWIALRPVPPNRRKLCRSADGGGSWDCPGSALEAGLTVAELAVDPRDVFRVLAAVVRGGGTDAPDFTTLYETTDGGATLVPAAPIFAAGVVVTDLAFDPRDPETVWAATTGGGVFRSLDGGHAWEPVNRGLTSPDVHELAFDPSGRVLVAATEGGLFRFSPTGGPAPPDGVDWLEDPAVPGFRTKVRIDQGGGRTVAGTKLPACIPETLCVAGALPDRAEVFVRMVGPKPNGRLWPTLVKFSTSRLEIWIQQLSTGELRYYELSGASPGVDELPGLFDRTGFLPD